MTVRLRAAASADIEWLRAWLAPVAISGGFDADLDDLLARPGGDVRIIRDEAARVGVVVVRLEPGATSASIELVATPPEHARRGIGMQAAALAEEALRRRGVRRVYAPAAASHGIAMYFWIRLGYRPLLRGEWPCARDGVAWLSREIGAIRTA